MENSQLRTASMKLLDTIIDTYQLDVTIQGELPKDSYNQLLDTIISHSRDVHNEAIAATVIATNRKEFVPPKYVDR